MSKAIKSVSQGGNYINAIHRDIINKKRSKRGLYSYNLKRDDEKQGVEQIIPSSLISSLTPTKFFHADEHSKSYSS